MVRNKLLEAVAVLWKLAWLDETDASKNAFMQQLVAALKTDKAVMGARMMQELLSQFMEDRSANIHKSLGFHRRCRESFQVWPPRHASAPHTETYGRDVCWRVRACVCVLHSSTGCRARGLWRTPR